MAAKTTMRLHLDQSMVKAVVESANNTACANAARRIIRRAKDNASVNTGALRNSITGRPTARGVHGAWQVQANRSYAMPQEYGTGPIYPVKAKVLRFKPKGSNAFVFARKTRGVPATHFMQRAVDSVRVGDFLP